MELDVMQSIKRKCSSSSCKKGLKHKRREAPAVALLDLSDCTLLHVLQFLDATSLYQLGRTCTRLERLVQDESLWVHVDARRQPIDANKLAFCWENVCAKTKRLLVAGTKRSEVAVSLEALISSKKLSNLTVLALEHQCIKYCNLAEFPNTLEELSFRHSYIPHHTQFFRYAHDKMCNLKTLILDHCQWFEANSFISLCKFPKLEVLSLYMCKKLGEDDISNFGLAGNLGFKNLKVIDVRFTGLGDLFMKAFYKSPTIQIIYFQCFTSTYYLDRYQRKLDILNGAKMREHAYVSDDEANNDASKLSFEKRFGASVLQRYNTQTISDFTMCVFNSLEKTEDCRTRPKSYLYEYPYGECTCGFSNRLRSSSGNNRESTPNNSETDNPYTRQARNQKSKFPRYFPKKRPRIDSSSSDSSSEDDNWDVDALQRKLAQERREQKYNRENMEGDTLYFICPKSSGICPKVIYDCCATLPEWCQQQATPSNPLQQWLFTREPRNDYEIAMLEHADKYLQIRMIRRCGNPEQFCNCTSPTAMDNNVIVVRPGAEDGMPYIMSYCGHSNPLRNNTVANSKAVQTLIDKTADCIIKHNYENIGIEILAIMSRCLGNVDFLEFLQDTEFVLQLTDLLCQLSGTLQQDVHRVLQFHSACFEELIKQLCLHEQDGARKQLLTGFFKNLLYSENQLVPDAIALDQRCFLKKPASQRTAADENWNLPGPSGLQSMSKPKKRRKYDDSDAMQNSYKNDSDSDASTKNGNIARKQQGTDREPSKNEDCDGSQSVDSDMARPCMFSVALQQPPGRMACIIRIVRPDDEQNQGQDEHVRIIRPVAEPEFPTNIRELSLRGYHRIGDETLLLLRGMELSLLDVTGTRVTLDGVHMFLNYNPECRLIHEDACTCRPKLHF